MKIAASHVLLRIVVWIRNSFWRFEGQLSEEVRITSVVKQGRVLGPLLVLSYVNDIWKHTESTTRLLWTTVKYVGK